MYKPFRAALEALRGEFSRTADRHPDLFVEWLDPPSTFTAIDLHDGLLAKRWAAFFEANKNENWEEWHTWRYGCWRFYGVPTGIEEFKRLAESLHFVLCEMDEHEPRYGWLQCLETMRDVAGNYPTPLLRTKARTWRA